MDGRTRFLMIASLVVNLFLAGALVGIIVVGARAFHDRDEARRDDDGRPGMWSAFQAIPRERRQELRAMMREPAIAAAPELRAAREARSEAARLIAEPNYDVAKVSAALKLARDHEAQARAAIDAGLASRLGQLTAEERAAFGRIMLRGPRGPGGDGDRDRDDRGRDRDRDGPPPGVDAVPRP